MTFNQLYIPGRHRVIRITRAPPPGPMWLLDLCKPWHGTRGCGANLQEGHIPSSALRAGWRWGWGDRSEVVVEEGAQVREEGKEVLTCQERTNPEKDGGVVLR